MAAQNQPLLDFIDTIKRQGASDEFVVTLLRQHGWSEKRIYQAFSSWYEARTGESTPNGGGRVEAAKDAFLYLLAFITLGTWTIQLGALLFNAIDRTFPNPTIGYPAASFVTRSISDDLAGIIVAFPLFLLVTRWIVRGVENQPERLESPVRKWLTYLALVITASTLICDVVTFLAYFLRGDLDSRFVLKVLAVLVIAGGVFCYYLDSLQRDTVSSSRNRWFSLAALGAVGFGIAVGFMQLGSPSVQRSVSEDTRRLFDLSSLAHGLHARWLERGREGLVLPPTLQDLSAQLNRPDVSIFDPVTAHAYEYIPSPGTAYQLCATFARPAETNSSWRHSAGRACFALDATRDVEVVQRPW